MDTIKQLTKLVICLLVGVVIGLAVGGLIVVGLSDTTFTDYFSNLTGADWIQMCVGIIAAIVSLAVSVPLLVVIHEAGHLVCGLLSGYRFVSFRIFSYTFIRFEGKIRVKRFSLAGTGGQCLLSPPELPLAEIPTGWYNLGGVLANVLALIAVAPLLLLKAHPLLDTFVVVFCLTDIVLILLNGIPLKINGMGNDAYNAMLLRKNLRSKRGLILQLRTNALIQEGVRPKDMPDEWFEVPPTVNYGNALEVSVPLMRASRLLDMEKWEDAYREFSDIYSHKDKIMGIYVKETACELVFTALLTGRLDEAGALLDRDLRKYIEMYRRIMSSKERLLCAIDLYLDNDRAGASAIYEHLKATSDRYLLQGEVKSDMALMDRMLSVES